MSEIRGIMRKLADVQKAEQSKKYLKSPYGFYGINVPTLRKIAKDFSRRINSLYEAYNIFDELWKSGNHEEMLLGLYIISNFKKQFNKETWDFLTKEERISKLKTWDHVDEVSSHTLGEILLNNSNLNQDIKNMHISRNPWVRRVSIVSQYPSIKKGKIQLTFLICEKLVYDGDIYVQKAAGWMLREAGKKNPIQVQEFIKIHRKMKPIALSYATEKMLPFRKFVKNMNKEDKTAVDTQAI